MAVKFWLAITFFVINLQAMETYPTCLRQTGLSIGMIGSNIIGIFGPYIVYLVSKIIWILLWSFFVSVTLGNELFRVEPQIQSHRLNSKDLLKCPRMEWMWKKLVLRERYVNIQMEQIRIQNGLRGNLTKQEKSLFDRINAFDVTTVNSRCVYKKSSNFTAEISNLSE